VGSDFPRYPTTLVELRDPTGEKWPLFMHGHVEPGGQLVLDPESASVSIVITNAGLATPIGDAHPVLFREGLPEIQVELDSVEGAPGISPGRRSSSLRMRLKGSVSCGENKAPIVMDVSGGISPKVHLDFIGGSAGIPLSFPGLGCSVVMTGTVPASTFPGGREGTDIHITLTAYGIEEGLRERICSGQVEPVLGKSERNKQFWKKAKEGWLKKAAKWR
jgi:hypothetical protein